MNEKKAEATQKVMSMEDIPNEVKVLAVIPIAEGYNPDFVIKEVEAIRDSIRKLKEMPTHLKNRRILAQYHLDHPDPKLTD